MIEQAVRDLRTVRDLVRWGASRMREAGLFFGHGTDNALDEALLLVLHAIHLDHSLPVDHLDARLTEAERRAAAELLQARWKSRRPAAYLTREAWFAGLSFYVDERVLVPRSPIAELIEQGFEPWLERPPRRVLDLCTGSGCIAIACAWAFPEAEVVAVDISEPALEVARINRERHGLEGRLELLRSDLFEALPPQRFDLIVSNPPYVSRREMASLPAEFHREPAIGLEAGEEGLDVVERILARAADYLEPGGVLIVEVGNSAPAVEQRWPQLPFVWLEFERGGEGVFLLRREDLPPD